MLKVCEPSPPVPTMSTKFVASATSTLVENSRMTWAAAVISPMVSFLTRSPVMMAAIITGRHLARHDLAHQVQHFVVEDFTVFDGALQGFLRCDFHGCARHAVLLTCWMALPSAPV